PLPDAALPTSGRRLPVSGSSASRIAPVLPRPVSNTAQSIPSPSSTSCSSNHAEGDRSSSGWLPKSRRSNSYSPSPPTSDTTTASQVMGDGHHGFGSRFSGNPPELVSQMAIFLGSNTPSALGERTS